MRMPERMPDRVERRRDVRRRETRRLPRPRIGARLRVTRLRRLNAIVFYLLPFCINCLSLLVRCP